MPVDTFQMEPVKTTTTLPTPTTPYPPLRHTTTPYPLPPATNNPYNRLRSVPPTTLYPPQPRPTTLPTPTPYHPVPTYSSEETIDEILYAASE